MFCKVLLLIQKIIINFDMQLIFFFIKIVVIDMSSHVKENCEHKHEYKSDLFQLEFDLILVSPLYYVAVR